MRSAWDTLGEALLFVAVGSATALALFGLVVGIVVEGTRAIARLFGWRPRSNPRHARRP